jgi:MFS family permease
VFGAIYVQDLLGFSPVEAGLSLLPITIPLLLLAPRAGRIYDRLVPRVLVATGAALIGAALICTALLLDQLEYAWLVPGYAVAGIGLALVMTPASTDAMNAAPAALRGEASGVMQTMRQVGGTVGLAIMGTVAATAQANQLDDYADRVGASASQRELLERASAEAQGDPAALQGLPAGAVAEAQDALVSGIQAAYEVGGAVVLAGAVLAALLLRRVRAADAPAAPVPATPGAHPALRVAAEDAEP